MTDSRLTETIRTLAALGSAAAVLVLAVLGFSRPPAPTIERPITIAGTIEADFLYDRDPRSYPSLRLEQDGKTKYSLKGSYSYGSFVLVGVFPLTSIASGTYDIVVTLDSDARPDGSACSCSINGNDDTDALKISGAGPYTITIRNVELSRSATMDITLQRSI